ncbi:response regulator [Pseudobacteriovorax antillogorgiicola]|uniref:Response regulator receiver domain-containing protein n=1 Tax=Pseudobacteriovorax antillogorgiicola TaxID=1513793 RepID=A0A1Y6CKG8_9BACT|nr:response regulator [Pseudobacteriovorax antillogorgiicola]TCS46103.1 response regulator receiver domain-containing protein [Pseudobacteriovorax antillogorgiicola]SMF69402.1 Response regulator receiver domain-containing protein [Pseudobacteriovorax antillogorgiicola]
MTREKKRCLIIDDSYDFGVLMEEGIREYFESDVAQDAFTAQQLLSQKKFDIILSDIQMPFLNGLDLAQELRRKYINIPTIFITGDVTPEISKQALQIGAANLLEKPVNIPELVAKMQLAIQIAKEDHEDESTDHELGYIYNLLKSHYYDIQEILYQIQYYHVPISVVKEELDKKERMGKCHLDDPENIKFLGSVAS